MQPPSALVLLSAATLLVAVTELVPTASAFQVGSQGRVMWDNNCDFYGQDSYSVRAGGESCGDLCINDSGCTHWTWTNYNGGTCWFKSGGNPGTSWLSGAACGYVVGRAADASSSNSNQNIASSGGSYNNGLSAAETSEMLSRINSYRAQNGVGALTISATLMAAALLHSQQQAQTCTVGHPSPDGTDFSQRITNQGYHWSTVSENVAGGQTSVDQVMTAWYNSPAHKKNLLDSVVTEVGFAKATNSGCGSYQVYWTQDFAKPA
ncbi:Scp-like extracellular protein [Globisporangium polare]